MAEDLNKIQEPSDYVYERTVGELTFRLPKLPPKKEIAGWRLSKKSQKFVPPNQSLVDQISRKINNDEELTQDEVDFVILQNKRRQEGYWFYNDGNIEYITGLHYLYLSAWKITVVQDVFDSKGKIKGKKKFAGLPTWTDSDRDYFYFWDQVVNDKKCTGMCHITNRRDGKTYRAGVTIYDAVISQPDAVGAIQSKTGKDAKDVFLKIVKSWQMLPAYYKPVDTGDTRPVSELRFDEPAKRSSKTQKKEYSKVLRSVIAHYASAEEQLDGMYVTIGLMDEFGKYSKTNAAEMYRVNRECVSDGTFISGKYLLTSTVEDMDRKGGRYAKEIWDDSDPRDKNELGMTRTGLYRYFKEAFKGLRGEDENGIPFINSYGYSDHERTKEYLLKRRKNLKGSALSSERRKYPLNIHDCFVTDGAEEVFSSDKLEEQIWHNESLKGMVRTGNFVWMNDEKTQADFIDDAKGKFKVTWVPPVEQQNSISTVRGVHAPANYNGIGAGADPYDHKIKKDGRKLSDAGFFVFRDFDFKDPTRSNTWVCQYIYRREDPEDMYDEVLAACVFYGTKVLIEHQKPGMINYFNRNGYGGYVEKTRKSDLTKTTSRTVEDGISMAGELVRNQLINKLKTHIYLYVGKIEHKTQKEKLGIDKPVDDLYGSLYLDELITDFMQFDAKKWTDYDATVGAGLAYLCCHPVKKKMKRESSTDLGNIFDSFKI